MKLGGGGDCTFIREVLIFELFFIYLLIYQLFCLLGEGGLSGLQYFDFRIF